MNSSKIPTIVMLVIITLLFGFSVLIATDNASFLDVAVQDILPDATPRNDDNDGSGLDPAGGDSSCTCSGVAPVNQGCASNGCPAGTRRECYCISSKANGSTCQPSYGNCECVQDSACNVDTTNGTDSVTNTGGNNNTGGSTTDNTTQQPTNTNTSNVICTPGETRVGECGQGNCTDSFLYVESCNAAGTAFEFSECRFSDQCISGGGTASAGGVTTSSSTTQESSNATSTQSTTTNLPSTSIDSKNLSIIFGICLTILGLILLSNSKLLKNGKKV